MPQPTNDKKAHPKDRVTIQLDRYVPALLTWISNKLSRGASVLYLENFGVGIETWRCLVLLAAGEPISAQTISQTIGLDKASVSRCFKRMLSDGLIELKDDAFDKRSKLATITAKGQQLHNQIMAVALVREQALLKDLTEAEVETLLVLLNKMHKNLPSVEAASQQFVQQQG
ncbi:MarR family winged helix-turn-helix transcriptional regulator [Halioxenophilus aromaticivorans]|uniref:MarR family transcriptional regulator n=1 Tax=Halioxenophilus aromaticivorans TaxID=1306992 RepID=A0AAV3TYX4_9ALTE